MRFCLASALVIPLVCTAAFAADGFRIVAMSKERPVVVLVRSLVDGKPASEAHKAHWQRYVGNLHNRLDANGDGALDEKEASGALTSPVSPRGAAASSASANVAFNFLIVDGNNDGKVTVAELAEYYRRFDDARLHAVPANVARTEMEGTSRRLMTLLDADHDGKLSQSELSAARESLAKWDRNEDEMVSLDELPVTVSGTIPIHVAAPWLGSDAVVDRPFVILDDAASKQQETTYAKLPVDVEVTIELAKRPPDKPAMTLKVVASRDLPRDCFVEITKRQVLRIGLGSALLELRRRTGRAKLYLADRDAYVQAFKNADRNRDGALDRSEASQFFPRLFDLLDANRDGKVEAKELDAYLDETRALQAAHLTTRLALTTTEPCNGLMGLLDKNRDGRLSLREARLLTPDLLRWDRNRDGGVAEDELPESLQLAIGLGRTSLGSTGKDALTWYPRGYPMVRLDWAAGDLGWFFKMDRNRDGDVSFREFLGPTDVFRKMDADRDGLLSASEASTWKK